MSMFSVAHLCVCARAHVCVCARTCVCVCAHAHLAQEQGQFFPLTAPEYFP